MRKYADSEFMDTIETNPRIARTACIFCCIVFPLLLDADITSVRNYNPKRYNKCSISFSFWSANYKNSHKTIYRTLNKPGLVARAGTVTLAPFTPCWS